MEKQVTNVTNFSLKRRIIFMCVEIRYLITLRGQTVHSLHYKRNPQLAKIIFVAESATLLLFSDLQCCFGFHKQTPNSLYRSKSLQKWANLRNPQHHLWKPEQFVESTNE